jgi:hypothetical protein
MNARLVVGYLAVSALLLTVAGRISHAVPTDFDGDEISDVVTVKIGSDKKLAWSAKLSTNGQSQELGTLGAAGDHLAMAQWFAGGTQIGVVSLIEKTGKIRWVIKKSDGTILRKIFGERGDLVVSGADFNGNGTTDAAVARLKNGQVRWEVWYDMFAASEASKVTFTFGKNGDRAFFARVGSDAVDWVGVVRKGSGTRSVARMRNLVTTEVKQFTRLPRFASVDDRPRAFAIRQDSGPDLLGFSVKSAETTAIRVFRFNGTAVGRADFDGAGTPIVGEFSETPGFEVAFIGDADAGVFNPVEGEINVTEPSDDVPVDEININTVGTIETPDPDQDSSGGGSGGGSTGCSQTVAWPSSHIYKIRGSEHFSPSDVRRNTVGVVLRNGARGPFPSCVDAITRSGQVVAKLGLYARNDGWAARYYAGWGCGASTAVNGGALASRASQASGSSSIYMKFDGVCYGPINPSQCIGSSQC